MKIATYDIETSALSANFGIVLCAVVKPWQGECKVFRIDELPGATRSDDTKLVAAIIEELNQYMILVAHNGVKFDRVFLNTRATKNGTTLLNPRGNMIDPVILARKYLRMSYNGLDTIAQYFQTSHQKTPVMGHLWIQAVIDRDEVALQEIINHCMEDVYVLEEVAEKLVPFVGKINEWGG